MGRPRALVALVPARDPGGRTPGRPAPDRGRLGDLGDVRAGAARCTSAPADHPVFLALAEHVRARHPDDRPVTGAASPTGTTSGSRGQGAGPLAGPGGDAGGVPGPRPHRPPQRGAAAVGLRRTPSADHELARLQTLAGHLRSGRRRRPALATTCCRSGPSARSRSGCSPAPARLEPFGYAVSFDPMTGGRWVGAQVPLDDRSTVDLVGRVTRPLGWADPVTWSWWTWPPPCVDLAALDRLMRHVYTLRRRFTSACVHGVLVADGVTVALRRALWEQGFDHVSLSELGFRDFLRHAPRRLPHPRALPRCRPAPHVPGRRPGGVRGGRDTRSTGYPGRSRALQRPRRRQD